MGQVVEALVAGGQANPGPPLGPALGPLGVNIKGIVDAINEKTKEFKGMQVPVKIIIDNQKNFTIEIGTPPTSALLLKELGIEKGSGHAGTEIVGNLTIEQIAKVARMKSDSFLAKQFISAVKEVMGTCVTMGVTIEGLDPRQAQQAVVAGKFNDRLGAA